MSRICSVLVLLFMALPGFGQSAAVVLSAFKVGDVIDPSAREADTFMIDLVASAPASLSRLEITLEDPNGLITTPVVMIPVLVKDGKPVLEFDRFSTPFDGKHVTFFIKVRNQFTAPYRRIILKGLDSEGKETNQVVFIRTN